MIDETRVTPATGPSRSANEAFKRSFTPWFWGSISVATLMHFLVFAFWPSMSAAHAGIDTGETPLVNPPTRFELPPPPEAITRPARPVINEALDDLDITIPPTDFGNNPSWTLPPPPDDVDTNIEDVPAWTAVDVYPFIKNRDELRRALEREYPPFYRDSGIGGTTKVWFYIDETGKVLKTRIHTSSGYEALDDAALRVAHLYEFSPALNRDKPVPVWVSLDITFRTREPISREGAAA